MIETLKKLLRRPYRLARNGLNALLRLLGAKAVWRANLHHEVRFWDRYLATRGDRWPQRYAEKLDPHAELAPEIAGFLPPGDGPVDILDVGAGPLTVLGTNYRNRRLRMIAVDPLAEAYDRMLDKHGITPVLRTIPGDAEQLSAQFSADSFDLVHAQNCIDHSYAPEDAILEMLKIVRKDGFVVLKHSVNEAERKGYEGLHQWNLSQENGDLIISARNRKLNFTEKHKELCRVRCRAIEGDWILTIIQRKA